MKKHCCLPPGALDELITRIDELERKQAEADEFKAAVEGAVRAFIVVFGIHTLPEPPPGEAEKR
jgi:hypothetical protein